MASYEPYKSEQFRDISLTAATSAPPQNWLQKMTGDVVPRFAADALCEATVEVQAVEPWVNMDADESKVPHGRASAHTRTHAPSHLSPLLDLCVCVRVSVHVRVPTPPSPHVRAAAGQLLPAPSAHRRLLVPRAPAVQGL